jgi:glucokinase
MSDLQFLGLESGGAKLIATLVDAEGRILASEMTTRQPHFRAKESIDALIEVSRRVSSKGNSKRIVAAGFGFGGLVERTRNWPFLNIHEPGWEELNAAEILSDALGVPVFCENDCNAAALAEALVGAGSREGVSFYITVGSGIGGGIVHDGRILECSPFGEGEIGHLVMEENGAQCPCGNRGCLEALCSGGGLAEMARKKSADLVDRSPLARRINEVPRHEVARELFAQFPGDPLSVECVETFCELMGRACATVMSLLTPRVIVFGGGVMRNQWLPARIQEKTIGRVPHYLKQPCRFEPAALGDSVVSLGAALYARQRVQEPDGWKKAAEVNA